MAGLPPEVRATVKPSERTSAIVAVNCSAFDAPTLSVYVHVAPCLTGTRSFAHRPAGLGVLVGVATEVGLGDCVAVGFGPQAAESINNTANGADFISWVIRIVIPLNCYRTGLLRTREWGAPALGFPP